MDFASDFTAAHAARCTACHGVGATPKPAGANIGLFMKYAGHSALAMGLSENLSPCRSTPTTTLTSSRAGPGAGARFQARFDVENLLRYIRRPLAKPEQAEILAAVLAAKRYTFIESGLVHPTFRELFSMVATRAQRQRVEQALGTTLATAA